MTVHPPGGPTQLDTIREICDTFSEYINEPSNIYMPQRGVRLIRTPLSLGGLEIQYSNGSENANQQDSDEVFQNFVTKLQVKYNIIGYGTYSNGTTLKYSNVPILDARQYNYDKLTSLMRLFGRTLFDPLTYIFGILTYKDIWCDHSNTWNSNTISLETVIQIKNFNNTPNHNLQLLVDDISNPQNQTFPNCTAGAPITSITYSSGVAYAPGKEQINYIPVGPYLILNLVVMQGLVVKYANFSLDKTTFLDDINIQGYDKSNKSYEICSFIIHSGATPASGHYTSLVKKSNGWWYCSDTAVNAISSPTPTTSEKDRIWNYCFAGNNVTTHIFLKLKSADFFLKQVDQINTNNYFTNILDETPFNPKGLRNLGNTCFFNSILQCLIHNPYIYHLFTNLCPPNYPPSLSSSSVVTTPTPIVSVPVVSPPPVAISSTLTPISKPSSIVILSWNMMFDCNNLRVTSGCFNNMINYLNAYNLNIFCGQEASWFWPARPQSHAHPGYPRAGGSINRITLNGYNDVDTSGNTKNIAWAGGNPPNGDICIIYWNPDYFAVDPNFPLTPRGNDVPDPSRIERGNIPKSISRGRWAVKNASDSSSDSRPAIGVRLIPRWDLSKRWIIISMHAMHWMGRTQLKTFVDPILDALNYQTADRIVLAGDFNELYQRGRNNLQSLDFKGPPDPIATLRLPDNIGLNGANWNNWRTCCRPHNIDRQFDLFYSNFPNADAKVKAIGINDMSDHNPIRMRIYDGPDY